MGKGFSRRDVIRVGGVVFVSGATGALEALLTACGSGNSTSSSSSTSSNSSSSSTSSSSGSTASCSQSTNVTRGPYFVDNQSDPNISGDIVDASISQRSDIRGDSKGSAGTQAGVPLVLTLNVSSYSGGTCSPLSGAQVHIWHCNAQGVYSDVQAYTASNFLRGFQITDANGQAAFTTIYPGWYSGRAVHIHVKVRIFDSSGNVTTEATTQLFFDDSVSTAVYAATSAYSRNSSRDTLNSSDNIYASESPALLVSLNGSASSGYTGNVSIGINVGTIFGG